MNFDHRLDRVLREPSGELLVQSVHDIREHHRSIPSPARDLGRQSTELLVTPRTDVRNRDNLEVSS